WRRSPSRRRPKGWRRRRQRSRRWCPTAACGATCSRQDRTSAACGWTAWLRSLANDVDRRALARAKVVVLDRDGEDRSGFAVELLLGEDHVLVADVGKDVALADQAAAFVQANQREAGLGPELDR